MIELLVVVATSLTLVGLFLPGFAGATERNRRAACRNHMRQILLGVHMYANDNFMKLPAAWPETNDRRDELVPVVSTATRACLIQYAGNARLLECPGLQWPFNSRQSWHLRNGGCVLGYNYLGGRAGTPWPADEGRSKWISPQTTHEDGTLPLVTDLNDWFPRYNKALAAHSNHGPIAKDCSVDGRANGISSNSIGAAGGNVGLLDGSVSWKSIRQMRTYSGSRPGHGDGCLAAW